MQGWGTIIALLQQRYMKSVHEIQTNFQFDEMKKWHNVFFRGRRTSKWANVLKMATLAALASIAVE